MHDGPGIRTVAFLKGCPLRCCWCSNPEGQSFRPELMHHASLCVRCGMCRTACPAGAASAGPGGLPRFDRAVCDGCADKPCAGSCPARALSVAGRRWTPGQLFARIRTNSLYYRNSGGGVTLSGGEPLAQPAFVERFLALCAGAGISAGLETCGQFEWGRASSFIGRFDFVYYDIKCASATAHRRHTGVGNRLIIENLMKLARLAPGKVTVTLPVVPGVNDGDRDCDGITELCRRAGVTDIRLMPYHTLGRSKYDALGRSYPMDDGLAAGSARIGILLARLQASGLRGRAE